MVKIDYYKVKQDSQLVGVKFAHSRTDNDGTVNKSSKTHYFENQRPDKTDKFIEIEIDEFRNLCNTYQVLIRLDTEQPGPPSACPS